MRAQVQQESRFFPVFPQTIPALHALGWAAMSFWKHFHHPLAAMVLLRVTLAVLLLFHGWAKITGGIAGIEALVVKAGLPAFLAYGVFIGEVIAPLLLLVGLCVVPAALLIAVNMLVALVLVHGPHWLQISKSGGWALELQAFFLITALVVAMSHSRSK
jgi:putative oxidoreductase